MDLFYFYGSVFSHGGGEGEREDDYDYDIWFSKRKKFYLISFYEESWETGRTNLNSSLN